MYSIEMDTFLARFTIVLIFTTNGDFTCFSLKLVSIYIYIYISYLKNRRT